MCSESNVKERSLRSPRRSVDRDAPAIPEPATGDHGLGASPPSALGRERSHVRQTGNAAFGSAGNVAQGLTTLRALCEHLTHSLDVNELLQAITTDFPAAGPASHPRTNPEPQSECTLGGQGAPGMGGASAITIVGILAYCDQLRVELEQARTKILNLEIALQTNRDIGAACGILMANHRIGRERAMELLRHASQSRHVKLRELAADVIDTGTLELPELPYASGGVRPGARSRDGRRSAP